MLLLAALATLLPSAAAFSMAAAPRAHAHCSALPRGAALRMAGVVTLPRNLKEVVAQIRESTQGALSARKSRLSVEMPVGFEFGMEGEKAKRKGGAKLLSSADIERSNREFARLFVGMFEGTGLVPLILFPAANEAAAAKKLWDAPGLEARVQALVPAGGGSYEGGGAAAAAPNVPKSSAAKAAGGGGGFGGGATARSGKKGRAKGGSAKQALRPLTRIPEGAEVVVAVAPLEAQLSVLRDYCDQSGMDKLVILLNPRLDTAGEKSAASRAYFADGGDGGFETAYAFVTQPLGVESKATPDGDPLVLWRAYPGEWSLARKPTIGPPRALIVGEDRPSLAAMEEAVAAERSAGLLGNLFGAGSS